jgi:hypothetical protein
VRPADRRAYPGSRAAAGVCSKRQVTTGLDLVRFYFSYSPPLARVIEREPLLRAMARVVLQPVADAARVATGR